MASNTQDNVNLAQGAPTIAVGQSLKTAREATGKGIAEVAVQLRIRQPFLEALEDGRHKDLPGGTYAVGFLRTYAEFLGLDGEEMVRRFRAEAAGELNARSELVFPSPVSEGRIPGGAVLFLGIVLAGIGYGVWYWLSSNQSNVAEMVPPLPERLSTVLNRPATLTGEAAKPAEPAKAEDTLPKGEEAAQGSEQAAITGKETEIVPPPEGDDEPKPATPSAAPAQPAPAPAAPQEQHAAAKNPAPPPPSAPAVATAPVPTIPTGAAKAEAGKPLDPPKPQQTATAPATPAAPAAPAQPPAQPPAAAPNPAPVTSAPAPEGKVLGQEHADARIQLKAANDDCWVQVREMDGQLLLSRLLRKGDSYMVPNRPGLTLMAGNAGALDVMVDGKKAPSLGNAGQVRRDIRLEPDKLLSGG